ncbi:MAG: carboxypeptidase-like regulatory domain-containing protein [candidate division WOR-3 bacterium]|nr:carboxypeptidase-like regulatory domain-containing protein [candidate division WOR-3 bacterium]
MKKFLTLLFGIALVTTAFAQQNVGSISGIVTDSVTGLPIFRAKVMAHGPVNCCRMAYTDSSGAYTINNLPAGSYQVNAAAMQYRPKMYPTPVQVVAGQNTPDINFALAPITPPPPPPPQNPGAISGVVTDSATGLPIANAQVNACRPGSCGGRAFTDANGFYTINNLSAGDYQVTAKALGYRPQRYPTAVTVVAGQTTADINFALVAMSPPPPPQDPGSISGVVTDSVTGLPIAGATVIARHRRFVRRVTTAEDGSYTITNLPPRDYHVMARAQNYYPKMYPSPVNVVSGQNTPDINFILTPRTP